MEAPFTSAEEHLFRKRKILIRAIALGEIDNLRLNLEAADLMFDTSFWIRGISKPLFILHAEDDTKVSFEFGGYQLFQMCSSSTPKPSDSNSAEISKIKGYYHGFPILK